MKYNVGDRIKLIDETSHSYYGLKRIQDRVGFLIISDSYMRKSFGECYRFFEDISDDGWININENSYLYKKNYLLKPKQFKLK
jgi:hypothetical protein